MDLAEINENSTTERAAARDLQLGGVGGSGGVGCCARRRGVPRTPPEKAYFLALAKINHFKSVLLQLVGCCPCLMAARHWPQVWGWVRLCAQRGEALV